MAKRKNENIIDITQLTETYQTALLNEKIGVCKKCSIFCSKYLKPGFDIASRTHRRVDILFIKDFSTLDEIELAAPFTSVPGLFFRGVLNTLDKFDSSIGFYNLVNCLPNDYMEGIIVRPPNETEIENCSEFLIKFLEIHKPDTIVCLGQLASKYVEPIVKRSGIPVTINSVDHPAKIIKSGGENSEEFKGWRDQLQLILKLHSRRKNATKTV